MVPYMDVPDVNVVIMQLIWDSDDPDSLPVLAPAPRPTNPATPLQPPVHAASTSARSVSPAASSDATCAAPAAAAASVSDRSTSASTSSAETLALTLSTSPSAAAALAEVPPNTAENFLDPDLVRAAAIERRLADFEADMARADDSAGGVLSTSTRRVDRHFHVPMTSL